MKKVFEEKEDNDVKRAKKAKKNRICVFLFWQVSFAGSTILSLDSCERCFFVCSAPHLRVWWIYFEQQQKEKSTYRTCSHINKCIHKRGTPITFQFYVTIILTPLICPTSTRIRLCVSDSAAAAAVVFVAAAAAASTVAVAIASVVAVFVIVGVVAAAHICSCSWLCVYMMLLMIMKKEKKGKKIIKRHKSRAATATNQSSSLCHRMKKSSEATKKQHKKQQQHEENCQRQMYENTERQQITNQNFTEKATTTKILQNK